MKNNTEARKFIHAFVTAIALAAIPFAGTVFAEDPANPYLKDLDIRQRPMAVLTPAAERTAGSKLSVVATLGADKRTYKPGEEVTLKVSANEECYIWVFDTGTSGKVHQIYPNKFEKKNFLAAGRTLRIPGPRSKYRLAVSPPRGKELLTVVAVKDNKPLTRHLIDQVTSGSPFPALRGTAASIAKDLSITLRKQDQAWTSHQVVFRIK